MQGFFFAMMCCGACGCSFILLAVFVVANFTAMSKKGDGFQTIATIFALIYGFAHHFFRRR